MTTAVDTNIFSVMWSRGNAWTEVEAALSKARSQGSIIISGAVFAEMLAYPGASEDTIRQFLGETAIRIDSAMGEEVWAEAGRRYARYALRRRRSGGESSRRILADFIIGAHALLHADRLLTLDREHYHKNFPELQLFA